MSNKKKIINNITKTVLAGMSVAGLIGIGAGINANHTQVHADALGDKELSEAMSPQALNKMHKLGDEADKKAGTYITNKQSKELGFESSHNGLTPKQYRHYKEKTEQNRSNHRHNHHATSAKRSKHYVIIGGVKYRKNSKSARRAQRRTHKYGRYNQLVHKYANRKARRHASRNHLRKLNHRNHYRRGGSKRHARKESLKDLFE